MASSTAAGTSSNQTTSSERAPMANASKAQTTAVMEATEIVLGP
ncbi:hypothetical protein HDA42_000129 [Streptomyces costaricanus]|uniref:Uncharacterized protein n=1 Tax=Streptomyces murinus TaxID=33900 RepID=A0A7W3RJA2_STRMR|nr:hypothetical protein [Streptomyces murinus]